MDACERSCAYTANGWAVEKKGRSGISVARVRHALSAARKGAPRTKDDRVLALPVVSMTSSPPSGRLRGKTSPPTWSSGILARGASSLVNRTLAGCDGGLGPGVNDTRCVLILAL